MSERPLAIHNRSVVGSDFGLIRPAMDGPGSVGFSVSIFVMITIACLIGTLLHQGGEVSGSLRAHPGAAGWMQLADWAGLTQVFTSWRFPMLLGLLAATLGHLRADLPKTKSPDPPPAARYWVRTLFTSATHPIMYPPIRALLLLSLFLAPSAFAVGERPPAKGEFTGVVTETMTSGGYIYLNVSNDSGSTWVATGNCTAEVGDEVRVPASMEMRDFRSATLNRTFPSILFAAGVYAIEEGPVITGQSALPEGHPAIPVRPEEKSRETPSDNAHLPTGGPAPVVAPGRIAVAPGGLNIEDCFAGRETHAGQRVKVRGVVVKYNPGIMGANWIHLSDGTGGPGTDDLVLKTKETAQVGDIVVTEGTIKYDLDIGAGYSFPAIIEDAAVEVEGKYLPAPADIQS